MFAFINRQRRDSGFTLLEIIMVFLIIAILLAMALPLLLNQQDTAKGASAKDKLAVAYHVAKASTTSGGIFPAAGALAATISASEPELAPVSATGGISGLTAGRVYVIASGTGGKDLELAYKDSSNNVIWTLTVINAGAPIFASPSQNTYQEMVVNDDPIDYWKLDDLSGTVAFNSISTSSQNGIYFNGVTLGQPGALTGSPTTSVGFNGISSYVDLGAGGDPSSYTGTGGSGWSTELWVKLNSNTSQQFLWSKYIAPTVPTGAGTYIYMDNSPKSFVCGTALGDGNYPLVKSPVNSATTGVWHHIVCELDPSQKTKNIMYLDGTQYVADWTATLSSVMPPPVGSNHLLGVATGGSSWLSGQLDDTALYNYPLSSAEVSSHYNKGVNG